MSTVHFYMSDRHLPDPDQQREWKAGRIQRLHESGKIAAAQCWIYQTFVRLEAAGCRVQLVTTPPESGIMIALAGSFPLDYRPPAGVFFAGVVADYRPHPHAHVHIVQNARHASILQRSVYVPLWTQPNLVPRDAARGDRFETAAFFGDPINLASELRAPEWTERLRRELGVAFEVRGAARWHDYTDVDCAIGIRDFSRHAFLNKPPTKLFNAWLAGVPFIGGKDSAYSAERHTEFDYLQATSAQSLFDHVAFLKTTPEFRMRMIENGRSRSPEISPDGLVRRWRNVVEEILPQEESAWQSLGPASIRLREISNRVALAFERGVVRLAG